MRHRPVNTMRLISSLALVAVVLSACTPGAGPAGGQATGKPSGKPEVAALSVGTAAVVRELFSPTLSYSGNVQARSSVNLVPKISARLEKLFYDVGDEVRTNVVMAELDHAQLDAQVLQAEAGLSSAQARLEQTQASAKQEDVDAAKAVVDQSQVRLEQAAAGGRPEEVAAARAAAAQAQAKSEQVARGVREEERSALQSAIDQAQAAYSATANQLSSAEATLQEAMYRIEQARAGLGGPGVRAEDIIQAQALAERARVNLEKIKNPRSEDIAIARAEVEKAESDLDAANEERDNCGKSSTTTRSNSTQKTSTGTTKSSGKSTSRQSCSDSLKDSLDARIQSAESTLEARQAAYEKIKNPSPYDIQVQEQDLRIAEAAVVKQKFGGNVDIIAQDLNIARAQTEVGRLRAALAQAEAGIATAQARLDAGVNPDPAEVRAATATANQARANLERVANADPFVVQGAKASLDQAQAQLNSRLRPYTEQEIRVAASSVDQAAAALQVARVQSAEAIIRAPFDAVVSQKLLNPGALASPSTPILALVSREVEVVVQVEEARIGLVNKGQEASLAVSAFPGKLFPAAIHSVAPAADPRSRTFAVRIVPTQQEATLKDGMFAQVNLTGVAQPALLVPNDAIVARTGRNLVFVVVNDRVQAREIKLGDSDGKRTSVLDGRVNPGDQVVVTNPDTLSDGSAVVVEQRDLPPGSRSPLPGGGQPAPAPGGVTAPQGVLPAPSPQRGSGSGQ